MPKNALKPKKLKNANKGKINNTIFNLEMSETNFVIGKQRFKNRKKKF